MSNRGWKLRIIWNFFSWSCLVYISLSKVKFKTRKMTRNALRPLISTLWVVRFHQVHNILLLDMLTFNNYYSKDIWINNSFCLVPNCRLEDTFIFIKFSWYYSFSMKVTSIFVSMWSMKIGLKYERVSDSGSYECNIESYTSPLCRDVGRRYQKW